MQFPNPIVSELHLVGSQTRVDIDGLGGSQPTIWFSNLDRSVSSFINAPSSGSPIDFMGLAMDSSPWTSNNLPGNPVLRSRFFLSLGTIDVGNIRVSDQGAIGGRLQAFDDSIVLYWTPGPNSGAFTSRVRVSDELITFTDNSNIGVCYDGVTREIKRFNNGTVQDWTTLTLNNGWTAKAGYYVPAYRFTPDGMIELSGTMGGGTSADNTIIATMPVVPAKLGLYGGPGIDAGGSALKRIFYNTDGKLYCYGVSGTATISLDGIRFRYK